LVDLTGVEPVTS